jgi:Ca2+-binding EF-hand superfamily protein
MAPTQREHQDAGPQTSISLYPVSFVKYVGISIGNLYSYAKIIIKSCVLQHWQLIFDKYDQDSDGRISLAELKQMILSESFTKDIPQHTVRQILKRADSDANGYIEYPEFLNMVCTDFV